MRGNVYHISKSDYTFLRKILNGLVIFIVFRAWQALKNNKQLGKQLVYSVVLACLETLVKKLAFVYEILLHNFVIFRMLFPAVLMNIPNSKVFLKRELSIAIHGYYLKEKLV